MHIMVEPNRQQATRCVYGEMQWKLRHKNVQLCGVCHTLTLV